MNKRIEKLTIEAFFDEETNQPGQKMYTFGEEKMQKFAELIVQECATAIINDSRLSDVRSAANGCVRTIKEHFGVEE